MSALPAGKHTLVFDFKYDGPGPARAAPAYSRSTARNYLVRRSTTAFVLNGPRRVAGYRFDTRTPVDGSYSLPFKFTGNVDKVTYKIGPRAGDGGPSRVGPRERLAKCHLNGLDR